METLVQAPAWVRERREQASRRFAEVGFPNTRQEDWRFTNVAPIADAKFALANGAFAQAPSLVAAVKVPGALTLAIVNGRFAAGLSDLSAMPKGLRIAGLRDGARDGTDGLEQHLAKVFSIDTHPFAALNTSHLRRRRGDLRHQRRRDRDADSHRHGHGRRRQAGSPRIRACWWSPAPTARFASRRRSSARRIRLLQQRGCGSGRRRRRDRRLLHRSA